MIQRTCVSYSLCYRAPFLNRGGSRRNDILPTRVQFEIFAVPRLCLYPFPRLAQTTEIASKVDVTIPILG